MAPSRICAIILIAIFHDDLDLYMTLLSVLLLIIYILENQVAKMSGSMYRLQAKVLVANRSGSEQV